MVFNYSSKYYIVALSGTLITWISALSSRSKERLKHLTPRLSAIAGKLRLLLKFWPDTLPAQKRLEDLNKTSTSPCFQTQIINFNRKKISAYLFNTEPRSLATKRDQSWLDFRLCRIELEGSLRTPASGFSKNVFVESSPVLNVGLDLGIVQHCEHQTNH